MRVKDLRDIRARDLKDVDRDDIVELLEELRSLATKNAGELLVGGRRSARRAIGAPDEGAVPTALIGGIVIGLIVGAFFALVFSPFSGEARQKLGAEVGRIREKMPTAAKRGSNGGATWEQTGAVPETLSSRSEEPAT